MSQGLSPSSLLEVWEQGLGRHPIDQALLVLRYAFPNITYESLTMLSIGQRDTLLLKTRQKTLGDGIEAHIECPDCHERLEFAMSCDALMANTAHEEQKHRTIVCEGMEFHIRCPNSRDIAEAATSQHISEVKQTLFARCITPIGPTNSQFQGVADSVKTALAAELIVLDPQAEILIDLSCPACEHTWQGLFDIVAFFWAEIHVKAGRLLQEIDVLARTYGWAEAEILHMTNTRRALYRDMALS